MLGLAGSMRSAERAAAILDVDLMALEEGRRRGLGSLPFTRPLPLDPNAPFLQAKGIAAHTARRYEAGQWHGRGFLAGCVGVRLHDMAGNPIGYAGRRLDREEARRLGKWRFPIGIPKSDILYGAHRLSDHPVTIAVTECPWGVLRLAQIGLPAVALLGTNLAPLQRQRLGQARRVVLLFDGDFAGRSGAERARAALARDTEVRIASLPDDADPDDLPDDHLASLVGPFFLS